MKFWDASAIIPLCIDEDNTPIVREMAKKDGALVVWWGSMVESYSAFVRLMRDKMLTLEEGTEALAVLSAMADAWTEIEPSDEIREMTKRLLQNYPLRAADSLQLSASIVWAGKFPKGHQFVCLDGRLRDAATKEGFEVLPSRL
jgi:predicted nucleic acid-binding protein